jgi:alpha-galactosidase
MRVPLLSTIASVSLVGLLAATQAGCAAPRQPAPSLPPTPPMGWNSWNSGIELTEQNVKATIDAMVSSGMRDAGYRYVNLDAGWAAPQRGSRRELQADPARFPDRMAAVARYAHDRGMFLGLYASPYDEGCSAQPALASVGHETVDAQSFAAWGVDYLKYDWCRAEANHDEQVQVFSRMRDALRATGRPIVYSINPNSSDDYTAGARYDWSGIADMTRVTTDLVPVWRDLLPPLGPLDPFVLGAYRGVPDEFGLAQKAVTPSRPGYWADPDMMVVGVGWDEFVTRHFASIRDGLTVGEVPPDQLGQLRAISAMSDDQLAHLLLQQPNLTDTEQRAHLSLWAMLSAPLIVGSDVRSMSPQTRDILTNREVIAVDQDPRVAAAHPLPTDNRVLTKQLSDGGVAVAFFNAAENPVTINTGTAAAGLGPAPCYTARDLWAHTDTTTTGAITSGAVPPHAVTLLRISPVCK